MLCVSARMGQLNQPQYRIHRSLFTLICHYSIVFGLAVTGLICLEMLCILIVFGNTFVFMNHDQVRCFYESQTGFVMW